MAQSDCTITLTLSKEASRLERSVMRKLIQVASTPGVISLAGGLPADEFLPTEQFAICLEAVLNRDGGRALQYGPIYMPLQDWIADFMRERGASCTPEQVFITNGNQQSLTVLSRLLVDEGEPVVTEAITFTGIQQATKGHGAKVITISVDLETGANIDELESILQSGVRPRMVVIIPDFHNPLGVSLSEGKRIQVAQLTARYHVPIIEDDPYSALRFEGDALSPIKAFDEAGYVFYIGSFSKMVAPGARLGWIVAPQSLIPNITTLRESIDLESSTLIQRTMFEFLDRGYLAPHLAQLNRVNRERRDALLSALETHLGDIAHWTKPRGGLFVWVTLPKTIDAWALLDKCVEQQVAYIPGAAFAVDGGHENTLRLNFSKQPPETLHEGVERLARVINAEL